jgi:hypothetical protein
MNLQDMLLSTYPKTYFDCRTLVLTDVSHSTNELKNAQETTPRF